MQAIYKQHIEQMSSRVQNLGEIKPSISDAIPKPINKEESYDDYWGDRGLFAAGVHGYLSLYADKEFDFW